MSELANFEWAGVSLHLASMRIAEFAGPVRTYDKPLNLVELRLTCSEL